MTRWRVASNSLATLLLLAAVCAAEPATLTVPAVEAPRVDGKLDDPAWQKGVAFEITRDKESYGELRMLRSGRQLYVGYRSAFKPLALGVRFHFTDPETRRTVAVLVAPLELPRAPMSAWLSRGGEETDRLDASKGTIRFDMTPEKGFTFVLRLPLDLLEIGRPKKRFLFDIELWDTQARRPMAFYPSNATAAGVRQGKATLEPAGDWGVDVPADAPEPPRNEGIALLEEIAAGGKATDADSPVRGDAISIRMGHLDGKRQDAPLAALEARLQKQADTYPDYASVLANLVRVQMGRNKPDAALASMRKMRERFPILGFDGRQALIEFQLLRDSGRYSEARAFLAEREKLFGKMPNYKRELAQIEAIDDAWKAEEGYRAEEAKRDDLPRVRVKTNRGEFVLELFEDDAPNTVANFLELVGRGFYDGTRFHWAVGTSGIFGGDPNSRDKDPYNDGFGGPGYMIEPEQNKRASFPYTIAMVPLRRTEWTMGSNFSIHLAPANDRDGRVTVFGRIVDGFDVVKSLGYYDTLEKATVVRKRDHTYTIVKRLK